MQMLSMHINTAGTAINLLTLGWICGCDQQFKRLAAKTGFHLATQNNTAGEKKPKLLGKTARQQLELVFVCDQTLHQHRLKLFLIYLVQSNKQK